MEIVLILLALAWGAFAWFRPRHAVMLFPAFLPAYVLRASYFNLPTTFLEMLWGVTLLITLFKLRSAPWNAAREKLKTWALPIILWCIASAIGVAIAPDQLAAFGLWRAYFFEPIVYFILLVGVMQDAEDRARVIRCLIFDALAIALWSSVQFLTNLGIPHPWDTASWLTRRATGPFPFPNAVSLFTAPIAALCIGLWLDKKTRIAGSLGTGAGALAIVLAKSVGGTLAILSAAFISLTAKPKLRKFALGGIVLALILIFAIPQVRTPTVTTLTFKGWSGQVRLFIWRETWAMLKDRPLFGAGLGAYPTVFKPYHKATAIEIFQYPHNILLNLWSELGLLGVAAFIWLCIVWFKTARSAGLAYALPLIAILVQGLVDVPYFKNDLAFAFWIFVALAISGGQKLLTKSEKQV